MIKQDELQVGPDGNLRVVTVVVLDEAETEALDQTAAKLPEPFGGKGDHDDNGTVGGAHAPIDEPVAPEQPEAPKRRGRPPKKR